MSIFKTGRLCVKLAGRDAGKQCVVVEDLGKGYVVVDGMTRRKKVNVKHLEPLERIIEIKNKASHADVVAAFEKMGLKMIEKKPRKAAEKPKQHKARKETPKVMSAKSKKPAKKESSPAKAEGSSSE